MKEKLNRRNLKRFLKRHKEYKKRLIKDYLKKLIYSMEKFHYCREMEVPPIPYEISIIENQIEVLEKILKESK